MQPTPPSSWPACTRSPACDRGRLDHVHVDVGAVALAVVEVDVVALPAVAPGLGDHARRSRRPPACPAGRTCPGRRGCGRSARRRRRSRRCRSRLADDRQERARGLAALVAVRAGRPVGDPLERAPGLVVNRDVRGGGLSGLGGGRRSGAPRGSRRGRRRRCGLGFSIGCCARSVSLRSQRARRCRGACPRSAGNRSRGRVRDGPRGVGARRPRRRSAGRSAGALRVQHPEALELPHV